jgi:hypothetical protein
VRDFNTKRKSFPTNIFAKMLGFRQDKVYYEVDESQAAAIQNAVQVNF